MASLKTVEKLRARAGVSYEDAREALDNSDDDMLDALIWLEKNGKVEQPRVSRYSTDEDIGSGSYYGEVQGDKTNRYYDSKDIRSEKKEKKAGKTAGGQKKSARGAHTYSSKYAYNAKQAYYYDEKAKNERASIFFRSAAKFIGKAFHVGNATMFEISRYGNDIIKIPLTIVVIAFIVLFHVSVILLPLGLFFGFRYNLSGEYFNNNPINTVMKAAADTVDKIKDAFLKNTRN